MMREWPKLGQRWGPQSWRLRARVSAAPQVSSSSVESGDCPSPTAYCWCLDVHVRRPNASTRPLHLQPNPFSQSSCIPVIVEGGSLTLLQRFVADIAIRHYHTSQLTSQAQIKLTPQADQELGQHRSCGTVSSSGLNLNIGCWNSEWNPVFCTMEICWLPKSKKLGFDCFWT